MKFGLKDKTLNKLYSVFAKFANIDKVVIYGSRAKGTHREGSDIDITLFGDNIDYNLINNLSVQIDELNTPYLFDISIYSKLQSASLKEHIDRVGKVFYSRKDELISV